ncbi:MAG: hypothetical protein Q9162_000468 [Coniocarpon cinnabarinum]
MSISSTHTPPTPSTPMPAASTTPLQPTFAGFVSDTKDALLLFEAVLQGMLNRVTRRPHDRERASLIRSGSIFIYEEGASGIKRWTDGVSWSPSRILGNFLIYRELEKPFPPGEKKRAKPKVKQAPASDDIGIKQEGMDGSLASPTTPMSSSASTSVKQEGEKDAKRALLGSLTESYNFKDPGGLVKKTMSVNVAGSQFHLVSYYDHEDVEKGLLESPGQTTLKYIRVRDELVNRQNFRTPIDEANEGGMQPNAAWATTTGAPQQNAYLPTGNPSHSAFMSPQQQEQEYLQRGGPAMPGAMSPPSSSYHAPWSQPQDPRNPFADQRYPMSASSPVPAQNPYLAPTPGMTSSMQMRPDFAQYPQPSYSAERYQQYPDQHAQHPHASQSPMAPYSQQYSTPGPSNHGWPPR